MNNAIINTYYGPEWVLKGRGKQFFFCCSIDVLEQTIIELLPIQFKPYVLILSKSLFVDGKRQGYGEYCPIESIGKLARELTLTFLIQSIVLTPKFEFPIGEGTGFCHNYGVLFLNQLNDRDNGIRWRIAMSDRIINMNTGEVVTHKEYVKIYNALKLGFKEYFEI